MRENEELERKIKVVLEAVLCCLFFLTDDCLPLSSLLLPLFLFILIVDTSPLLPVR